eukprot:1978480-Amphidinium_carterae.1
MTRWGTWHDAVGEVLPQWHAILLLYLHLGVAQGWVSSSKNAAIVNKLAEDVSEMAASSGSATQPKTSMKEEKKKLQKLRDKSGNTLQFATACMADGQIFFVISVINLVTSPLRKWHGIMSKELRSEVKNRSWHVDMAVRGEGFLTALDECTNPWLDLQRMKRMGFIVDLDGAHLKKTSIEDPLFLSQQQMSETQRRLSVQLLSAFLKAFAYKWASLPHGFAGFLSDTAADVSRTAQFCKSVWLAYKKVSGYQDQFWCQLCNRCPLQHTFVAEFLAELAEREWVPSEEMISVLRELFGGYATTLHVEEAFQKLTDASRDKCNDEMSAITVWRKPVVSKLLETVFAYKEIEHEVIDERVRPIGEVHVNMTQPQHSK